MWSFVYVNVKNMTNKMLSWPIIIIMKTQGFFYEVSETEIITFYGNAK